MITRLIAAALAAAALLCTGAGWARADNLLCGTGSGCRAAAVHPSPVSAPAGAHAVGRIDAEVDAGSRAIMVSGWYPTTTVGELAQYVPATSPVAQARIAAVAADWMSTPTATTTMVGAQVPATESAPVAGDRLPVVVVSPGMGCPRWILSGLAAELASRGYVVVVIDHVGESPAVQFPDGRTVFGSAPTPTTEYMRAQLATRTADMRAVLDHLAALPIVGAHVDLDRIAAVGHSYGGTTAVQLAAVDPRVRAVIALDGPAGWDGAADVPTLDRPTLLLNLTGTWAASWSEFRDPRFEVAAVPGAGHYSAADLCEFGAGRDQCGTLPADRAATVSRGVIASWLDARMVGADTPRYPASEIRWQ